MGRTPGWTICGRRPSENGGLTGAPLKMAGCATLGPRPGFALPRVRRGSWAYLHAAPYEHLPLQHQHGTYQCSARRLDSTSSLAQKGASGGTSRVHIDAVQRSAASDLL